MTSIRSESCRRFLVTLFGPHSRATSTFAQHPGAPTPRCSAFKNDRDRAAQARPRVFFILGKLSNHFAACLVGLYSSVASSRRGHNEVLLSSKFACC
jgi:hypothetical protein